MKSVLIIEDDENNMLLISDLLMLEGYTVHQARSGEKGAAETLTKQPDFIILDIGLPDIDGFEVIKRIRSAGNKGSMPVIAMTSYAMSGDQQRLIDAGCNGYIDKPINPALVIAQLETIIEKLEKKNSRL